MTNKAEIDKNGKIKLKLIHAPCWGGELHQGRQHLGLNLWLDNDDVGDDGLPYFSARSSTYFGRQCQGIASVAPRPKSAS